MPKKKTDKPANKFLETIKLLSLCQIASGEQQESYCRLENGCAVAFNGIIAAGEVIEQSLDIAPHTFKLAAALGECGERYSLTHLTELRAEGRRDQLGILSGDFQAAIPCCEPAKLTPAIPDALTAPLNDDFKAALAVVAPLASDKAEYALGAAIQIRNGSVLATDMVMMLEAWHGLSMPDLAIPRAAATALLKCGREITGFGFSDRTMTFWLGSQAWIRTQLFTVQLPELKNKLIDCEIRELPKDFFEAISKVTPFADGKPKEQRIFCYDGFISSHRKNLNVIAKMQLMVSDGLKMRSYNASALKAAAKHATAWNETQFDNMTMFVGGKVRGALAHEVLSDEEVKYEPKSLPHCGDPNCNGGCNVCIPF